MEVLEIVGIYVGISFVIAFFLGRKRQIGFGWSFFFCLFPHPIFGFIMTMLSRKYYDPNQEPSKSKKVWGCILIVFFSLSVPVHLNYLEFGYDYALSNLSYAIGFIGLGFYLIIRSKGKNFNTEAQTKTDE